MRRIRATCTALLIAALVLLAAPANASSNNARSNRSATSGSWSKISVSHEWSGYSCSFNPSISVSAPWGVSVSGWPSCGSHTIAKRTSSYGKGDALSQLSTGVTLKYASWNKYVNGTSAPTTGPCYGSVVAVHLYKKSKDDLRSSGRTKVCLSPTFS